MRIIRRATKKPVMNRTFAKRKFANESSKILVKWCTVDVHEDDYEEGEGAYVQSYDLDLEGLERIYESIQALIKDIWGQSAFSDSIRDYAFTDANGGEIFSDVTLNDDNDVPSSEEIEAWKRGKLKLYNHHLSCGIELITTRPMTNEDAEEMGLEVY